MIASIIQFKKSIDDIVAKEDGFGQEFKKIEFGMPQSSQEEKTAAHAALKTKTEQLRKQAFQLKTQLYDLLKDTQLDILVSELNAGDRSAGPSHGHPGVLRSGNIDRFPTVSSQLLDNNIKDMEREVKNFYLPDLRDAVDNGGPGGVERTLVVSHQACVGDLLDLVRHHFQVPVDVPLRLLEVTGFMLRQPPFFESRTIKTVLFKYPMNPKQFRVEPVPPDQRALTWSLHLISPEIVAATGHASALITASADVVEKPEILMPVGHFHKGSHRMFGTPFVVRIVDGDTFATVRERIRGMLGAAKKDMEKWKLCIIHMGMRYTDDEEEPDKIVPVVDLIKARTTNESHRDAADRWTSVWLGLDHVNTQPDMGEARGTAKETLYIRNP